MSPIRTRNKSRFDDLISHLRHIQEQPSYTLLDLLPDNRISLPQQHRQNSNWSTHQTPTHHFEHQLPRGFLSFIFLRFLSSQQLSVYRQTTGWIYNRFLRRCILIQQNSPNEKGCTSNVQIPLQKDVGTLCKA